MNYSSNKQQKLHVYIDRERLTLQMQKSLLAHVTLKGEGSLVGEGSVQSEVFHFHSKMCTLLCYFTV